MQGLNSQQCNNGILPQKEHGINKKKEKKSNILTLNGDETNSLKQQAFYKRAHLHLVK